MTKWRHRDESKKISKWRVSELTTPALKSARNFVKQLLDLRKSEKLYKTYIQGVRKAAKFNGCDKIYVDYKLDGTITGRLSCTAYTAQESKGVSFHTLPRETENNIRSIFVAPDGYKFITVEYSAMDLRVLAHVAKEYNMQKAFIEGRDLHSYTGSLLFNKKEGDVTKEERQIAKTVSFLIVYGGGAFNLAETMGIRLKRAEKIIEAYKNVYPGIFKYMEFIEAFIKKNGYAYSIFGRRRNLPDVASRNRTVANKAVRQGINFTIQSTASDVLVCSLLGIVEKFKQKGMKARIVSTVHDSIEAIAPADEVDEACRIIYDEMVNYPYIKKTFGIDFSVPLDIEVLVGESFGDGEEIKVCNEEL